MKLIILALLSIIILSCDNGPVEPTIRIASKEESLKQKHKLEERFAKRHQKTKEITKKSIEAQEKRRKFMFKVKELNNTDENKIAYYLEVAQIAKKDMRMNIAVLYAKKVLAIDPKNIEAKKIIKHYKKLLFIQERFTPSEQMKKRTEKMLEKTMKKIETMSKQMRNK